jgi:hypothetical protein
MAGSDPPPEGGRRGSSDVGLSCAAPSAEESPEVIREFLAECGAAERHFNEIQARYRALASTWLLATFAGIGFVLSAESFDLPVPRLFVVAGIALAGTVGLVLLWNLDVRVYHRLLDAYFWEGLRLESRNPWVPQVRQRMLDFTNDRGVLPRVNVFYIAGVAVEGVIAAAAFTLWGSDRGPMALVLGIGFPTLIIVSLGIYMGRRSPVVRDRLREFSARSSGNLAASVLSGANRSMAVGGRHRRSDGTGAQ